MKSLSVVSYEYLDCSFSIQSLCSEKHNAVVSSQDPCGEHRAVADEGIAGNGIYEVTRIDELVLTDTLSRKPWTRHNVHRWLPEDVEDGRKKSVAAFSLETPSPVQPPAMGARYQEEDLLVGSYASRISNDENRYCCRQLFYCGGGRIIPRAGHVRSEDMAGYSVC